MFFVLFKFDHVLELNESRKTKKPTNSVRDHISSLMRKRVRVFLN